VGALFGCAMRVSPIAPLSLQEVSYVTCLIKLIQSIIIHILLVCHRPPMSRVVRTRSHPVPPQGAGRPYLDSLQRTLSHDTPSHDVMSHVTLSHVTLSHVTLMHGACISRHRWHPDHVRWHRGGQLANPQQEQGVGGWVKKTASQLQESVLLKDKVVHWVRATPPRALLDWRPHPSNPRPDPCGATTPPWIKGISPETKSRSLLERSQHMIL
jgi:hypothetical protein